MDRNYLESWDEVVMQMNVPVTDFGQLICNLVVIDIGWGALLISLLVDSRVHGLSRTLVCYNFT